LETDPDAYKRFDLWVSILKMVTAQPFWGFGPGTFPDVYPAFQPSSLWDKMISLTHNEYLQVAVECGLPALLLTLLFLFILMRDTGRGLLKARVFKANPLELETAECAFFILLFEVVHNSVDFTFHEWSHRLVLFAFVTFALHQKRSSEDVAAEFRFSRVAYFIGVGLLFLFIFWTMGVGGFRDYLSRLYDFKAHILLSQGDVDRAETLNQQSLHYRSNYMDPWNSLGAIEDARAGWAKSPKERERHFQLADAYFRQAIELSPYSLAPVENEVSDLTKRGKLALALDLQTLLVQRAPAFPTGYLNLGSLQLRMGKPLDALVSAEAALEIAPYYLQAHILKAQALESLGKPEEALQKYKELKNLRLSLEVSAFLDANIQRLEKNP